jgi:tetratricopeptide (TPR) repeat protein
MELDNLDFSDGEFKDERFRFLYFILSIKIGIVNYEKVNKIVSNLDDYWKDYWKIFTFDFGNFDHDRLSEFISLLDTLKRYKVDLIFIYKYLYLFPDYFIDFYLFNYVLLFLVKLTEKVEDALYDARWDKLNLFKGISLEQRKHIFDLLKDIIKLIYQVDKENYLYLVAKIELMFGNLDRAISLLYEILNYNKYFYPAKYLLSCIYHYREMYDLAMDSLIEIYDENNEIAVYLMGKNYLSSKSFKLADDEFSILVNKYPNKYKYLYYKSLANVYMMNFKFIENIEMLYNNYRASVGTRLFLDISLYLAYLYILVKKYNEAENILLDLLKTYPYEEDIYRFLSIIYISNNQVPKVLNVYNMGLKNIPDSSELYSLRGILYYKANKLDLAYKDFVTAYDLNCYDFVAVSHLGFISLKRGDYEAALSYFRESISIKPLSFEIYSSIGSVYEKIGKVIEAKEYYEMAYEHNPSNIQNLKKLIELLKKLSDNLKLNMIKKDIEKNANLDQKIKLELISMIEG